MNYSPDQVEVGPETAHYSSVIKAQVSIHSQNQMQRGIITDNNGIKSATISSAFVFTPWFILSALSSLLVLVSRGASETTKC